MQREELVGVRLPKGGQQVIATLGIMMSGGAYLPMEMNWPEHRCKAPSATWPACRARLATRPRRATL